MDESRLLAGLRKKDEHALAQIIDHYAAYVHTVAAAVIGDRLSEADVEETMADAFLALWNSGEKVLPGKLKAYIGALARNQARQRLRQAKRVLPLEEDVLNLHGDSLEEHLEQQEETALVYHAVLSLGEPDREIFLRHYYYGQPIAEIAKTLDMNPATVKTRLHRGRARLREVLEERR